MFVRGSAALEAELISLDDLKPVGSLKLRFSHILPNIFLLLAVKHADMGVSKWALKWFLRDRKSLYIFKMFSK